MDKNYKGIFKGQEAKDLINTISGLSMQDMARDPYIHLEDKTIAIDDITDLSLKNVDIRELPESIGDLRNLQNLDLSGTQVSDISVLSGLTGLTNLGLSVTQVSDISALSVLTGLTNLDLSFTQVSDINALSVLTSLTNLDLSFTTVSDISALSDLTGLTNLDLRCTQVSDINALSVLTSLTNLNLMDTQVRDISVLSVLTGLTNLDLSWTQISDISVLSGLTGLTSLYLRRTPVSDISVLSGLTGLTNLNLSSTQVSDISVLSVLTGLTNLDLSWTQVSDISVLSVLTGLTNLNLSWTQVSDISVLSGLTSLTNLNLPRTQVSDISVLSGLTGLTNLDLSGTHVSDISTLSVLTGLTNLNLIGTQVSDISALSDLTGLTNLNLIGTQVSDISVLSVLTGLTSLDLSGTQVRDISAIDGLKSLTNLDLRRTQVSDISALSGLTGLTNLDLSDTQIYELPESISNLSNLQILGLRELHLSRINRSVFDLNMTFFEEEDSFNELGINIYGLSLDTQPVSLFLQPRPLIEEYFNSEMDAVNTVKCIILGYGNVGKTYTLSRILEEGEEKEYVTSETPGVEIRSYAAERESRSFTINFWDFGGQEIMYSMHRCFLTERSCYLIVVDNRRSDMDMMAQARYWLKNIAGFTTGAPVIIMANMWERDEYRDDIEIRRLRVEFGGSVDLKCVIPISAKTSSKRQFREFMDRLIDLAAGMVSCDMEFPVKWNRIRLELHNMGREHRNYYISQEDYYSICCKNGVKNRDIQNWLLEWFNDLGDCFSYYKPDADESSGSILEEYKVLDPRWITNAIYILITRGYGFVDHQRSPGILTGTALEKILEKAEGGVVKYIKEYKDYECSYIMRVMDKFELAYDVTKEGSKYFIPSLLTKKEPEQKRPKEYKQLVKYVLKYDFLPSNTLHKLMVRYYDELELSRCWDKGMVLRNAAIDQWVLMDMGGGDDRLRIEVFACGEDPACKMLNLMLYRLQKVNESLSLKPVHYIVTPDEYEEEIEVEHLLELKNGPRKSSIYQGRKKDYSIEGLLGNMFGPAAGYVEKLSTEGLNNGAGTDSYMRVLLEGIVKIQEDKDLSLIITRRPLMGNTNIVIDSIYNEHADQSSQTVHGDIHNNPDRSNDIEKLTDLLYDNLPVLTKAIQEIAKSDEKLAGDLRDINVQMTMVRARKEEAAPAKQKLISKLSTSADLMTILQGLLAAASAVNNPAALTDTILRLIQNAGT